jgi:beta-glucosidase-like glycosyl hydrolase
VASGKLKTDVLHAAVRRLLLLRFKLGLFDPAATVEWNTLTLDSVDTVRHRAVARKARVSCIVQVEI